MQAARPSFKFATITQLFKDRKLKLDFFEADFDVEEKEYVRELTKARKSYNLTSHRIVYAQQFSNEWKRTANEHLQYCIEYKRLMFAARPDDNKFDVMKDYNIANFDKLKFLSGEADPKGDDSRKLDFIENQSHLIKEVKAQCCLIQLRVTSQGSHTFELPKT